MLTSLKRNSGRLVLSLAGSMALLMAVGCADVVTYTITNREKGMAYYESGQYVDAAGAFKNVVRQEPRDYRSRYYLGSSYAKIGQYQQAIQCYRAALDTMNITFPGKRDPEFRALVIDALAQAIAQSDQRHVELETLETQARAQSSGEMYFILAKAYRYGGDLDTALERYNQATLLAPQNAAYLKEYGLFLEQIGKVDLALTPLRRANAINPDDQEVAAALLRHGIVPGPSLKERDELARPLMPNGPLPDVDLATLGRRQQTTPAPAAQPQPTNASGEYPIPTATVQHPRD